MKKISILGSTGSIGVQTLDVVSNLPGASVVGLSAGKNIQLLEEQIRKFKPKIVSMQREQDAVALENALEGFTASNDVTPQILWGEEGACAVAEIADADLVVCAIVGAAGLKPTVQAIKSGKDIALANKETLVCAGGYVMRLAKEKGVKILPVDSEHYAIFQCLQGAKPSEIKRIILTASGGALWGKTTSERENITPAEALAHPNWSMGSKITIDSATLMNKALEVIEAHRLFGVSYDQIEVVVHRQSIIHSMVEFVDGSVMAQLATPDMRLPIQSALTYPNKVPSSIAPLDFAQLGTLTFDKPDTNTFKCLDLGIRAGQIGGSMPAVMNMANEVAVENFLRGEIKFLEISEFIEREMNNHKVIENPTLEEILQICV